MRWQKTGLAKHCDEKATAAVVAAKLKAVPDMSKADGSVGRPVQHLSGSLVLNAVWRWLAVTEGQCLGMDSWVQAYVQLNPTAIYNNRL